MYYSKSYQKTHSQTIAVPHNYSGNTFRVIDETDRTYKESPPDTQETILGALPHREGDFGKFECDCESKQPKEGCECHSSPTLSAILPHSLTQKEGPLQSLLNNISVEDILILGIMLTVYTNDPNDPTLLLLLMLLLTK